MKGRTWMVAATLFGVAAVVAVVVAVAAKGSESVSAAEYETAVVQARDRLDSALSRIARPTSKEDLFNRIDDAGAVARTAGRRLDELSVDGELGEQNDELVRTLEDFSAELTGTADTFRDPAFSTTSDNIRTLNFPEWDKVNAVLGRLQDQGIDVQPLARH
jgi:hypothetical protein